MVPLIEVRTIRVSTLILPQAIHLLADLQLQCPQLSLPNLSVYQQRLQSPPKGSQLLLYSKHLLPLYLFLDQIRLHHHGAPQNQVLQSRIFRIQM